jgi:mRNA interferase RelE/StbE
MIVEFDKSFEKAIHKINDESVLSKIEFWILKLEDSSHFKGLSGIKKLQGYRNYYRIRIGEYRLGFEHTTTEVIRFITIAHRKDIYKRFP